MNASFFSVEWENTFVVTGFVWLVRFFYGPIYFFGFWLLFYWVFTWYIYIIFFKIDIEFDHVKYFAAYFFHINFIFVGVIKIEILIFLRFYFDLIFLKVLLKIQRVLYLFYIIFIISNNLIYFKNNDNKFNL